MVIVYVAKSKRCEWITDTDNETHDVYAIDFAKDVTKTLDTLKLLDITDLVFPNLSGRKATDIRALLNEKGQKCRNTA